MKKSILLLTIAACAAFAPLGFPDLTPDPDASRSFATQYGNKVSCTTRALVGGSPVNNTFRVGFYLSPDTTISTTDKLIGTYTVVNMGTQSVTCSVSNIDLSTLSVANGTYYVGAFVDIDNSVSENGMTPEIENNGRAFRNSSGVFKIINYPGLDVGLSDKSLEKAVTRSRDHDGNLVVTGQGSEILTAELRAIDGRLITKCIGTTCTLPAQPTGIYVLTIVTEGGKAFSEKVTWR